MVIRTDPAIAAEEDRERAFVDRPLFMGQRLGNLLGFGHELDLVLGNLLVGETVGLRQGVESSQRMADRNRAAVVAADRRGRASRSA